MENLFKNVETAQYAYGLFAVFGGVARYLNGYANGKPFKFSVFIASAVVAGFSGLMFALVGTTLNMPENLLFAVAGIGGFFGEQTMKFLLEYVQHKLK